MEIASYEYSLKFFWGLFLPEYPFARIWMESKQKEHGVFKLDKFNFFTQVNIHIKLCFYCDINAFLFPILPQKLPSNQLPTLISISRNSLR